MDPLASAIVYALSIATVIGQILAIFLFFTLVFRKKLGNNKHAKKIINLISENYITLIFVVGAMASAGSLSLSEIANFAPCKLCWYQRVFMYPIALISLTSLVFNEGRVKKFVLAFSTVGILISVYHILMQVFPKAFECSDEVAKCSAVQFAEFGYITIPVMSFTAFAIVLLISLLGREK